jgi:hypothetical protein
MSLTNEISLLVSSDSTQGASNKTPDGAYFEISLGTDGLKIPNNAYNTTLSVEESTIWWTVPNIITGSNDLLRVIGPRASDGVTTTYNLVIPQGLYDLSGLNTAVLRLLENSGATTTPDPLINFIADEATQKVVVRLNYLASSVVFVPQSCYTILGFNLNQTLTTTAPPENKIAPNVAQFNQVNYFLIHSDLTNKGIRFNNNYYQVINQVLIDVPPGSQIVSRPFNPPKIPVNELNGVNKSLIKFWLTDDQNRLVNTNGENWSCRIVIKWNQTV